MIQHKHTAKSKKVNYVVIQVISGYYVCIVKWRIGVVYAVGFWTSEDISIIIAAMCYMYMLYYIC